jgi:ClpP class serine protease
VRQVAAAKPTVAVVNGVAASAAYAIASGASEIVTTETGVSGSIGIVMVHADFSRNLDREGITPTLIFAGSHKVDGNPFEPLPDAVRADLQSEVDAFYEHFLATVALGRGSRMTAEMARATGARTLIGAAAVKAGLADRVGSFESVLAELQQYAPRQPGRSTSMKGKRMEATLAPNETGISQADHDRAVAAAEARGAMAATDRLAAIIGDTSIKGQPARMTAALDLAVKASAMPAADVVGFVTANLASAAAATDILARMDKAAEGVVSSVSSAGTTGEPPKAAATTPEGWAAEWELSDKLRADYPNAASYVATRKREAARAA